MGGFWYAELLTVGAALLASLLFSLQRMYALILAAGAALSAPILLKAVRGEREEYRRFCDINSYMQQFISAMQLHKRIPAALEEVYLTFPDGQMHEVLRQMIVTLRRSGDVEQGEADAFSIMQEAYPTAQLTMIHEFAMRVEKRGGEFAAEMRLLSLKREKWEKRTEHCQSAMKLTLYTAVILYVTMIAVCAMVLRMMPSGLSVTGAQLSQISEVCLLLGFFWFIYCAVRNTTRGWIRRETSMGEAEAQKSLAYIKCWSPRTVQGIKRFWFGHRLYYRFLLSGVRREMEEALPHWLFDVCLLMQKYNITVSITESQKTAPPILREEIAKLLDMLKRNPSGADAYLGFLEEYRIANVKTTMRMMVAIGNGTTNDTRAQMEQLIAHNMNLIDELDEKETQIRDAFNVRYNIYPVIPGGIVMVGYLISMIVQVFRTIGTLI